MLLSITHTDSHLEVVLAKPPGTAHTHTHTKLPITVTELPNTVVWEGFLRHDADMAKRQKISASGD